MDETKNEKYDNLSRAVADYDRAKEAHRLAAETLKVQTKCFKEAQDREASTAADLNAKKKRLDLAMKEFNS